MDLKPMRLVNLSCAMKHEAHLLSSTVIAVSGGCLPALERRGSIVVDMLHHSLTSQCHLSSLLRSQVMKR